MTSVLTNEGLFPWVPMFVLALITGMAGSLVKKLVLSPKYKADRALFSMADGVWLGWRGVFVVTLPLQSAVAGMLLTLLAFKLGVPTHPAFGEVPGSAMLQGGLSGILAVFFYDALIDRAQYTVKMLNAKRRS